MLFHYATKSTFEKGWTKLFQPTGIYCFGRFRSSDFWVMGPTRFQTAPQSILNRIGSGRDWFCPSYFLLNCKTWCYFTMWLKILFFLAAFFGLKMLFKGGSLWAAEQYCTSECLVTWITLFESHRFWRIWESNPRQVLGRYLCYHYTNQSNVFTPSRL